MYHEYFGLREAPFAITPDPTFVYLSQRHRDALAHLLYGVGQGGSGGFVQLTGEVGTGKTTLCRCLLEQVPEGTRIALVLNPLMGPLEMLAAICEELGVDTEGAQTSSKALVDRLNRFLLEVHERGERVVVVVDEAQNLSPESLEQIRLLTNLETSKEKLLQIILLGQPELRELLRRRSLRQLAQRITARYHLTPLGPADTARYVSHRLDVAGASRNPFTRPALRALYQRSLGVPRLINIIADRAMAGAYARELTRIDASLVNAAADEVQLGEPGVGLRRWPRVAAAILAGLAIVAVAGFLLADRFGDGPGAPEQVVAPGEAAPAGSLAVPERAAPAPQPVEEPAPPETAPETIPVAAPGDAWFEDQHLRAWEGLAAAWGRPADGALIEATCQGRAGLGYACLRDQGNLRRIRELGLPVVLALRRDGAGRDEQHLLLRGLGGGRLRVGTAAEEAVVDADAIGERWYGDYFVVWPQAANWPREVARGDAGPAVDTILQLAAAAKPPYEGAPRFDADFERWLTEFQQRQGLNADGIVGPKTLLYLMRFSISEPRLLGVAEGGG